MKKIELTKEELINVFRLWFIDGNENPNEKTIQEYTEDEYSKECADSFLEFLNKVKL
jgi:hypothetical protein